MQSLGSMDDSRGRGEGRRFVLCLQSGTSGCTRIREEGETRKAVPLFWQSGGAKVKAGSELFPTLKAPLLVMSRRKFTKARTSQLYREIQPLDWLIGRAALTCTDAWRLEVHVGLQYGAHINKGTLEGRASLSGLVASRSARTVLPGERESVRVCLCVWRACLRVFVCLRVRVPEREKETARERAARGCLPALHSPADRLWKSELPTVE